MARRTRITTTVREDDPVRPRRSRKNNNTIVVVLLLVLLGLFLLNRTRQQSGFHPAPASAPRR